MNYLEELIRQAINEGKFDNLEGEGKPLTLEENPLEDPERRLANKILADSGFAPGWIQKRREIEDDLNSARIELLRAWEWFQARQAEGDPEPLTQSEWDRSLARFQKQVGRLNISISAYNLETPGPQFQRTKINFSAELERIKSG